VIVGGGFAGLYAAKSLDRNSFQITLIDRRSFHLFQPLLYQVATSALSRRNRLPLRYVLRHRKDITVTLGEVVDLDVTARTLLLRDGTTVPYDSLLIATGATHSYFAHPEWASRAPGLKTIEDATDIRARILLAFEHAENAQSEEERRDWLTFAIVGGGPTGVEIAGALAEIARDTLRHDFRRIDTSSARICLIEGSPRLLHTFDPSLSASAEQSLNSLGVETHTSSMVTTIDDHGVTFTHDSTETRLPARTVLWAAGVQASPLGRLLADRTGAQTDRAGRVLVQPDLTLPNHPEIFVAGDLASGFTDGKPWPGVAPTAMQHGAYVAKVLHKRLHNQPVEPFRYWNKGSLATIGRNKAVAEIGPLKFSGLFAWLAWLLIHIFYIIEFETRVLIVFQWAYDYITFNRGARLITGSNDHSQP
jgi:NADH dehydrogenase